MDSTPIFGLGIPSADGSDGADLAALLRTLGLDVEGKAGGITAMTSAARAALTGAGKYEGRVVHETDTDTLWRSDGTNWRQLALLDSSGHLPMGGKKVTGLAAAAANGDAVRYEQLGQVGDAVAALGQWAAWSPTLTMSAGSPVNWTATGRYTRLGNLVIARFSVAFSSGIGTATGATLRLSFPVAPSASQVTDAEYAYGQVVARQAGGVRLGAVSPGNASYMQFAVNDELTPWNLTTINDNYPWGWGAGGTLRGQITYEAA